jgi:hypothetical protein
MQQEVGAADTFLSPALPLPAAAAHDTPIRRGSPPSRVSLLLRPRS